MKRPHQENDEEELVLEDDLGQKDNKILKLSSPTSSQEGNASCAQDNDSIPHINRVPSDCLVHIFEYCPAPELSFTAPLVCRTWHNIISLPHVEELLWKQLCLNEWPVLLFISTSATQIENDSFLNGGGFKGWKQFFHRYATVIPPLLHENVPGTIMQMMDAKKGKAPSTILPSTEDIRSHVQIISSLMNSIVAKLDKLDQYQLYHQRFMKRFVELKEQAKQEMDTVLSDNKHELAQKMEQLFLDCFKLSICSDKETQKDHCHGRRSVSETKTLSILGPSGRLIQINLAFYIEGSVTPIGYYIDDAHEHWASCDVQLRGPKNKNNQSAEKMEEGEASHEMSLYTQRDKQIDISPNFIPDMNIIRKHLGLQHLSTEALWETMTGQMNIGHDNERYYEEMKELVQEMFAAFNQMEE